MTFSELKSLAARQTVPEREALAELSDKARAGDEEAQRALMLGLLPAFCSEYSFQMGPMARDERLLEDCLTRYLSALAECRFGEDESFVHLLSRHLRQARTDAIVRNTSKEG